MENEFIKSPLNYTGGKYKLLPQIIPLFPSNINTFVDLFCGGANVGVNIAAKKVIYNDVNDKLIGLLRTFGKTTAEEFITKVEKIIDLYDLSNSLEFGYEFYGCESAKGLGEYNREHYVQLRNDFNKLSQNDENYFACLFTLIIYAFNNQIRFNGKGEFNLPVGKRDFNKNIRKNLTEFIEKINKQTANFISSPFATVNVSKLGEQDFVYCDPPYLITTASYNESNGWTENDERDLLKFLDFLNEKKIKFALSNVTEHKGKKNIILTEWAKKYTINNLTFNYNNSSYHGTNIDKVTQEVLITNY